MTFSSPQASSINSANSLALQAEIGERLGVSLDETRTELPRQLTFLMNQFRLKELPLVIC